ncbi:MAG: CoA-binding protein [Dethiobacter sp.]|jgi:predicted CoA-binding protein|nr:CoA-binding protein [Dethiobacter sp.]
MNENAKPCSLRQFPHASFEEILDILKNYRTVAMVGLSDNPYRPSHFAAIYMKTEGYRIIPVNPRYKEVLGLKCYPDLESIPEPVGVVDIFRQPEEVPALVDSALEIGAKVIWMQLGVIHHEAAFKAKQHGLKVVMDRCMKIEHARFFGGLHIIGLNTGIVTSRKLL